MEIEKVRRKDEPMFFHYYCPNCKVYLDFIQQPGGCFCSNCGIALKGWGDNVKTRFSLFVDEGQRFYKYEKE